MYYFILNPNSHSSGKDDIWNKIAKILRQREIPYKVFASRYPGQAREISASISERDPAAVIIAIGGDGTVHDILCGLKNLSTVTLGLIPTGSGNDFARGMHIPTDTEKALSAILKPEKTVKMDVGCISSTDNCMRFGVSCGIGFDASVCHEALSSPIKDSLNAVGLGNLTYASIAAKQLLLYEPGRMTLELDGGRYISYPKAFFAAVMNQKYEGGGLMLTPDARPNDRVLNICVCGDMNRAEILAMLPATFAGRHTHLSKVHLLKCKSVTIHTDQPRPVHLDGESGGIRREIKVSLEPDTLKVITG